MFFTHALLLFLLGTSVNARPVGQGWDLGGYFGTQATRVKIIVPGLQIGMSWYRLELPTGKGEDKTASADVARINKDGSVIFFVMIGPGSFNSPMGSDLTNGNLRHIEGVWGALPSSLLSIGERNHVLRCKISQHPSMNRAEAERSGQVDCKVEAAKIPATSRTGGTTSLPSGTKAGDAWYRVKSERSDQSDINDVFILNSDGFPSHRVLNTHGGYGFSNVQVDPSRFAGTFRLVPTDEVAMGRRHELLVITVTQEDQMRKSRLHPGQTKVAKTWFGLGKTKTQQVLHYRLIREEPQYPPVPIPQPYQRVVSTQQALPKTGPHP